MREVSLDDIRDLVGNIIGNPDVVQHLSDDSALLGAIPELDSMAVVNILLGLEQSFGIHIDDDDVDVEIFDSLGSLRAFIQRKLN